MGAVMTHGEVWFQKRQELLRGKISDVKDLKDSQMPQRMNRKDAVRYYNTKLLEHWVDTLPFKNIKKYKNKKLAVQYLMFRDNYDNPKIMEDEDE